MDWPGIETAPPRWQPIDKPLVVGIL
jgi:hypothetical protein